MKNQHTVRSSALLVFSALTAFALIASLGLLACSDAMPGTSFPVTVTWDGGGSAASRGLAGDAAVLAVEILIYSDATGERIGVGNLAPTGGHWAGTISVSANGLAVFEANALDSAIAGSGKILYVGKTTHNLTGSGDSVTFAAGLASPRGGSIQGQSPVLTTRINTFAGTVTAGTGTDALPGLFTNPYQITSNGTYLFIADMGANNIRKIEIKSQTVTTFAGSVSGALGGRNDGAYGVATRFSTPRGITADGTYLYVADYSNHAIRRITISSGLVESYAGTLGATAGSTENAAADAALFNGPSGITTDGINLYVADTNNNKIRQIVIALSNGTRTVTTLSGLTGGVGTADWLDGLGTGARYSGPQGITTDGTNVYVADTGNNRIRQIRISDGYTSTLAGTGATGSLDGAGTAATFYSPIGITTDGTYLYVADSYHSLIRRVQIASPNTVMTLEGSGGGWSTNGPRVGSGISGSYGITTDGTNLYVSNYAGHTIHKIQ
ncbi:MAG: hypothetical protein Q8O15_00040 [Rectinemataceae bacterium]|nr:hypothetical protein [Rectinemataceae bacterium]